MVPVHNALRNPIHSVFTPRIVPKTIRTQASAQPTGAAASTGTGGTTVTTIATAGGAATATSPAADVSDPAADFKALFGGHVSSATSNATTPQAPPAPSNPTLQSVFGASPYVSNPGGVAPNGVTYSYNPTYFATRATAEKLAQMYGGTVVEANAITPYGPFQQNQMNEMIRFPNGNVVNAGILASYFDRGWPQDQINIAIAGEINQIPT